MVNQYQQVESKAVTGTSVGILKTEWGWVPVCPLHSVTHWTQVAFPAHGIWGNRRLRGVEVKAAVLINLF